MLGKLETGPLTGRLVSPGSYDMTTISPENHDQSRYNTIQPVLSYILAHCEGDNRPYLDVDILGIKFKALLDSGANNTIVGQHGWKILQGLGLPIMNSIIRSCTVANSETCKVLGSVSIPMKLENQVKIINALVIPELPHSIILGVDFWVQMGIIPDLNRGCWSFNTGTSCVDTVASIIPREVLTCEEKSQLDALVKKYFELQGDKIGCTSLVEHKIVTDSEPIKQRAYRVSPAMQRHIDEAVQSMLEEGVIEPSQSAWSSPVLLVPKKDGKYRFCVDYRRLNRVSKKDAYPLPYMNSILDKLRNAKYLSSLDIKSAYWQVPVAEESRELTAFTIPGRGLYHFKRMPFGLCNSPATFQRLLDRVLGAKLEPHVFVYLDDVIIVTDTFEKHLEILREVFERFREANLSVSKEKCFFCRPELRYLGYVVDRRGLHVDPDKVAAILNIPSPKNTTEVRRIIGIASWYRRFIPSFSTMIAPMTALLCKNKKWFWSADCEKSLQQIKTALISAPILTCPDFNRPFQVQTDASNYGISGVLSQIDDDGEHVICYVSRSLTRQERNYSTVERELLAVLFSVERLRAYLEGYKFTVVTDHHSLVWLHNLREPTGRLARWAVRLQQFDFEIIHRKGKEHVVPDLLSRAVPEIAVIQTPGVDSSSVKDKWFQGMFRKIRDQPNKYPQWRRVGDKLFKYVSASYPELRDENECWKEVIPKESRKRVLYENHDSLFACHTGIFKTFERLKLRYYWPKMLSDVARYVRNCAICLTHKPLLKSPAGHMGKHPEVTKPWQTISVDFFGPLPRSSRGYKYIFVVTDTFGKFSLFFPIRTATAAAITRILEEQIFLVFGCPQYLICDNGKQLRSNLLKKLCEQYKVTIRFTPYYHAQSNPVERVNQVLKTMLSCYVEDNHAIWDTLLPKVGCAIRSSVHETTGLTPFFVNFGREYISAGDQHQTHNFSNNVRQNIAPSTRELENLFKDVRKRLDVAHQRSKPRYNLRRRPVSYAVGEKVFRKNYVLSDASKQFTAKFAPKYVGPFLIKRKLSPVTYELADIRNKSKGIWHVKDLKAHPPDDSDTSESD